MEGRAVGFCEVSVATYSSTVKPFSSQQVLHDICIYFWISRCALLAESCVKLDHRLMKGTWNM